MGGRWVRRGEVLERGDVWTAVMVWREGSEPSPLLFPSSPASARGPLLLPTPKRPASHLPNSQDFSMASSPILSSSSSRPQVQRHRSRSISVPVLPQLSLEGTGAGGHFEAFSKVELILVHIFRSLVPLPLLQSLLFFSFFRSFLQMGGAFLLVVRLPSLLHLFPLHLSSDLPFPPCSFFLPRPPSP